MILPPLPGVQQCYNIAYKGGGEDDNKKIPDT